MAPPKVVEVFSPPTLQIVVPAVVREPSGTSPAPPVDSPRLIVPPSRLVSETASAAFVPRLKLALVLPVLYVAVPLLNRSVPCEASPSAFIAVTMILPLNAFIVAVAVLPPRVRVSRLSPGMFQSRLLMMTVPPPDHAPYSAAAFVA